MLGTAMHQVVDGLVRPSCDQKDRRLVAGSRPGNFYGKISPKFHEMEASPVDISDHAA